MTADGPGVTSGNFTFEVRLGAVPDHSAYVSRYSKRGPISGFLFSGLHTDGVTLTVAGPHDETPEHAEITAISAQAFADWAADHAAACREHADRLAAQVQS